MLLVMGLSCTKSLFPTSFAVSVPIGSEKTALSASPNESHSPWSELSSPSVSINKSKTFGKKNKDLVSPADGKKTSIFSSLGHKLTKTKPKAVPTGTCHVPVVDVSTSGSVVDGVVLVNSLSQSEHNQGESGVK